MKRMIFLLSFALLSALSAGAQGKPQSPTAGAAHSNAPASTPAASKDRDKGTARAEDVGKGKKKGLKKSKKGNKASTNPAAKK
jgi:protein-disulfide isomerase